ncbi:hypothetical protein EV368DRAFT_63429 [Lentinula lateritia]|nr:hypothetical protein EV368DRAFT_63429 [Lentinula lateritia]
MVVLFLASAASDRASSDPEYFGIDKRDLDWSSLFDERLNYIFLQIVKSKGGICDFAYQRKKHESQKRRLREYKLERHIQIASAMVQIAQALDNEQQYNCWSDILNALSRLGIAGMSDDNEVLDTQGKQGIIVYSPAFRHSQFDELFDKVDMTRALEKHFFTEEQVKHSPPANLPQPYYCPDYLEAMRKGLVIQVEITAGDESAIPSLPTLMGNEVID